MIFNIVKANAENKRLTEKVTELEGFNDQLKTENETLKQQAAATVLAAQDWATEKEALVKAHEEAIKALVEKHAQELKDSAEAISNANQSSAAKAIDMISSLGVEPEAIKISTKSADVMATFNSLTGPDKTKYYQANREEILRRAGLLKQ